MSARPLLVLLALGLVACSPPTEDAWNGAPQEAVTVRAWVERADVVPGKPFWLTVEVDQASDVTFALPDPGAGIKGLVIMDIEAPAAEAVGARTLTRQRFKLKAPLAGTYLIPGVEGPWTRGDEVGTAGSGPILVEAARTGGAEEGADDTLRDLKAPARPDSEPGPLIMAGVLGALLLLVIGAVLRARARRAVPAAPPRSAWEVALAEIATLERSPLAQAEDQGPFAFETSGILRRYVEARFGVRAWRMTTGEVLRALPPEIRGSLDLESALRRVLEASDRVKFAGEPVPSAELAAWLESVRTIVRATTPAEPAP